MTTDYARRDPAAPTRATCCTMMHCSDLNFLLEARQQMPGKVINVSTGSRLIFSA